MGPESDLKTEVDRNQQNIEELQKKKDPQVAKNKNAIDALRTCQLLIKPHGVTCKYPSPPPSPGNVPALAEEFSDREAFLNGE